METQQVRDMFIDWMIIDIRNKMATTPEIFIEETPFSYYNTPNYIKLMDLYNLDFFSKDVLERLEELKSDMAEIYWENTEALYSDDATEYANKNATDPDSDEWYEWYNDFYDNFNISYDIFNTYVEDIFTNLYNHFDSHNLMIQKTPFNKYFIESFDINLNDNMTKMIIEIREQKINELFLDLC
jgi:hypothetical protein